MWLFLCLCALAHAQEMPKVNTKQGVVVGRHVEDGDYLTFYGIPYAGNTTGENRFKAPIPPPVFTEEFQAIDNSVICAQPSEYGFIGTEDCLVLDILTKNLTTPKPVFVWIEGEDYEKTSTRPYPFENLVEDLVIVKINYRLSIFGFLCLGVSDAPGNAGLKDIVQGLKWIKENIAGFGGDPNNVVLVGHGSGAALVDLITLSPMSQNLAHKAIVLSGSALAPWAVSYNPISHAQKVAENLGYTDLSRTDLARKIASTETYLIIGALSFIHFYDTSLLFAPCVENVNLNPSDTFLADAPINILKSGNFSQIPYIAGFVNREGTLRVPQIYSHSWIREMQIFFDEFIQVDLAFESKENKTAVALQIREFYFGQNTINTQRMEEYLDYHGDILITLPIIRASMERAWKSSENVYVMHFSYKGTNNSDWDSEYPYVPISGARHGAILNYLFNFDLQVLDKSANIAVAQRFREFAYTGSPSLRPPHTGAVWIPVTSGATSILSISGDEKMFVEKVTTDVKTETRMFWDPILATHYHAPKSSAESLFTFGLVVFAMQALLRLL
ncbi:jg25233 [Pararge aegeria aegeria]|uniref:Jg25233 protein n=1 Tax=Pararge aegeria aegeria TaxID=348720 RepID=A0A8S4RY87_9NEOP|nr:jg25233 [Pararge aegeria aegeria]